MYVCMHVSYESAVGVEYVSLFVQVLGADELLYLLRRGHHPVPHGGLHLQLQRQQQLYAHSLAHL